MRFRLPIPASALILTSALLLLGCEKIATRYYTNGMKSEVFRFRLQPNPATGKLDTVRWGETTEWREDGNLASRFNYKAGVLDGTSFHFYENGEVAVRLYYRSGKQDSTVSLRRDGRIWERMVAGVERDTVITYDSLGNAEKRLRLGEME